MTESEFENRFDRGLLDDQYAEYIMEHCHGERAIGNGNMLILAMEDAYLFEDFKESLVTDYTET